MLYVLCMLVLLLGLLKANRKLDKIFMDLWSLQSVLFFLHIPHNGDIKKVEQVISFFWGEV